MPPGSYLAISSLRLPGRDLPELRATTIEGEKLLADGLGSGRWREDHEIRAWFGDWEMLPPGLVSLAEWRPDDARRQIEHDENYHSFFGGVARKPARASGRPPRISRGSQLLRPVTATVTPRPIIARPPAPPTSS